MTRFTIRKFYSEIDLIKTFSSIKFWIILFFAIRLIGITNPPLENGHNWRQCLTNMITRNLYETDNNPLYPRVDNGGKHNGIIASEFPVYNYFSFLISEVFGYHHWYGRLVSLIFSSLAIWYFYKLLLMYFNQSTAFYSAFLLMISIWFGFSRKIMPDVFSMSFMLISLYYAFLFLKTGIWKHILIYSITASIGVLAKMPVIYILSIFALPLLSKNYNLGYKFTLTVASIFVFAVMYWWYFVWGEYLLKTWEYQLFFPKNYKEGPKEFFPFIGMAFEKFYYSAFCSFTAFGVFLTSFFYSFTQKQYLPLKIIVTTFPLFFIFMVKTGSVFAHHNYYIIPFVPVMAICAGSALSNFSKNISLLFLILIAAESFGSQFNDFFIKKSEKFILGFEQEINKTIPANEKIALAGSDSPQYLYFAHRKGWGLTPAQTLDTAYMNFVFEKGYRYMVLVKRNFDKLPNYTKFNETNHLIFYKIKKL
ncbi:MAG: glycosyltransferase family 39 protein [Bacteroidetes bacterium]|nr:glycosyltransferase family 39 protein [Bacteroidota bacterium]